MIYATASAKPSIKVVVQMEYGCTYSQGQLIKFTDGSGVLSLVVQVITVCQVLTLTSMKKSSIIQPEEIGQIETELHRKRIAREQEERRREEAQFEQLAKKLGKDKTLWLKPRSCSFEARSKPKCPQPYANPSKL